MAVGGSVGAGENGDLRAERIAAAQATLAEAVGSIQSGEDWRQYLELQSRLHAYSANNVLLIANQHARAYAEGRVTTTYPSYVAGFQTWRSLGRSVEKGQKGYAILAPLRRELRVATSDLGEARVLRRGEMPGSGERVEVRRALRGFCVEHVFALEQTSGAALPTGPAPVVLSGEAPAGLVESTVALLEAHGYRMEEVPNASSIGGANGLTDFVEYAVFVRSDMDDAARCKTLLHEAGHVLLHDPHEKEPVPSRAICEVEAESVAFVVAASHDMATNDYSFPYVARWAGDGGEEIVRARAERIARTARLLIEASVAEHNSGGRVPSPEMSPERPPVHAGPPPRMVEEDVAAGIGR